MNYYIGLDIGGTKIAGALVSGLREEYLIPHQNVHP